MNFPDLTEEDIKAMFRYQYGNKEYIEKYNLQKIGEDRPTCMLKDCYKRVGELESQGHYVVIEEWIVCNSPYTVKWYK